MVTWIVGGEEKEWCRGPRSPCGDACGRTGAHLHRGFFKTTLLLRVLSWPQLVQRLSEGPGEARLPWRFQVMFVVILSGFTLCGNLAFSPAAESPW